MMINQQDELNQIDLLSLFGTFLGVLNYAENLKQSTNDDLMAELKEDIAYLIKQSIEQNKIILEKLDKLEVNKVEDMRYNERG